MIGPLDFMYTCPGKIQATKARHVRPRIDDKLFYWQDFLVI